VSTRRVVAGERIDVWLEALASETPEPGGGTFAALSAASGAALIAMVAHRTIRRYEDDDGRMHAIAAEADTARSVLLGLADLDAEAFQAIVEANRMPRETEKERLVRLAELQGALEEALDLHLDLARRAVYLSGLAREVVVDGDPNAAADGMAGAAALHAAAVAALANVQINAFAILDGTRRSELMETCDSLRTRADLMLAAVRDGFIRRLQPGDA
jgi:formiminotetrahydrofolate cyclodeaminase